MPSGLLGAIQRGAALKEVEAAPRPERPESALLQAIKSGGTLRKVVREQKPRPARRGLFGGEVDKILALRRAPAPGTDSERLRVGRGERPRHPAWLLGVSVRRRRRLVGLS